MCVQAAPHAGIRAAAVYCLRGVHGFSPRHGMHCLCACLVVCIVYVLALLKYNHYKFACDLWPVTCGLRLSGLCLAAKWSVAKWLVINWPVACG